MTKIDIVSGFLGAGKTTLIKKLLAEALKGEQVVLIENEFGEIGIDGGFLKDAGVEITEMNSGCISCSLVGDFGEALKKVVAQFHPDRIIIEPSGVGKLSDVIKAVQNVEDKLDGAKLNSFSTVVDASKAKVYIKNFGEFFNNQVESAKTIVLSRTQNLTDEKLEAVVALIKEHNGNATIITTPWDSLDQDVILSAMEKKESFADALLAEIKEHAHDDDDDDECDDPECECHHHHHDDDDDDEHEHEHHHHHHHDHDHDADEVFISWGIETAKKFAETDVRAMLAALENEDAYGMVLRAKGIVDASDGAWIHFDYVPGEIDVRRGSAEVTGRLCVIGSELKEDALCALFGVEA